LTGIDDHFYSNRGSLRPLGRPTPTICLVAFGQVLPLPFGRVRLILPRPAPFDSSIRKNGIFRWLSFLLRRFFSKVRVLVLMQLIQRFVKELWRHVGDPSRRRQIDGELVFGFIDVFLIEECFVPFKGEPTVPAFSTVSLVHQCNPQIEHI